MRRAGSRDDEIVDRCILALVNEGARILDEGIAQRASDIDVVYLTGYGFPRYRGGPMLYADLLGLFNVVRRMREFAAAPGADAAFWTPAPLLARLAAEGKTFNRITRERIAGADDRCRDRLYRAHRACQELARRVQHDPWRDARRSRRAARDRARQARARGGRRRAHRLRASGRRDRLEHRAPDRAARRLSGDRARRDGQSLLLVGAAGDRAGGAADHRRRSGRHRRRAASSRSPACRTK